MADFGDLLGGLNERDHELEEEEENADNREDRYRARGNDSSAVDADDVVNEVGEPEDGESAEIPVALQQEQERQHQGQQRGGYNDDNGIDGDGDGGLMGIDHNQTLSQSIPSDDYETLKQRWIQELNCTELLPYDHQLMEMFMGLVNSQDETLLDLQGGGSGGDGNVDPTLAGIAAGICKLDTDRISFILADLIRVRIDKIERYWMDLIGLVNISENEDETDLELRLERMLERMSEIEIDHLKTYGALYRGHMERSVTNNFPKEAWKKIDEDEMIQRPNLDTFCFCRVLDDQGVQIDSNAGINSQNEDDDDIDEDDEDDEDEEPSVNDYDPGSLLFVRYRAIRDLVREGRVELVM
eukprot:CAMPEP_0204630042 /NCGR_PEP_ID=MMETSP0717-20131115/19448_1 /ASSEMBLY_ACC=CAM_ASM_000666 /TAXON_ID=230516 /ORGANISM="Chaetoceros curvisetus" /LENGTH=354 /DNA_ID=CAMNT_0051647155 /DNA_START=27 /DNA_END=1091 /DNA_ORIENTATION=-